VTTPEGFWLASPAKVNLGLRVLGSRPDGYHEIVTWIQQVSLSDRIWLGKRCSSIHLTVAGECVPAGRGNLAYQAAAALRGEAGDRTLGARIHLEKHIPAGAGLGGGSGNAAAVLWGLNRLWRLGLSPTALRRVGTSLGSDVPSFLAGPASLCRGRGERVTPRPPLRRGWFVLAKPGYSLSTAEVYGWIRGARSGQEAAEPVTNDRTPIYRNDLEKVVFARHPGLKKARDRMLRLGASRAMLSGSGAALWGLFSSQEEALKALAGFRPGRGWRVWLARPLTASAWLVRKE